jgi:hypothetical protein
VPVGDTLKWDVVYYTDPRGGLRGSYTETWTLEHSTGLIFAYQPSVLDMLEDMPKEAATFTETHAYDVDGTTVYYRPENIVGSYAVFGDKDGRIIDGSGNVIADHGTGKLGHITRPLIRDSSGQTTWGILDINAGNMSVTIPGRFLNQAVYPVTLDPDFGYTTLGASETNAETVIGSLRAAPGSAGTGVSISFGARETTNNNAHNTQCYLYTGSSAQVTNGITEEQLDYTTTAGFVVHNFTIAPTISLAVGDADPNYNIACWSSGGLGQLAYRHDTLTGAARTQTGQTYNSWPNPFRLSTGNVLQG